DPPRKTCECRGRSGLGSSLGVPFPPALQAEENGTGPASAGDLARDPGQRLLGLALVEEALLGGDHLMGLAAPLPQQSGPGLYAPVFRRAGTTAIERTQLAQTSFGLGFQ